MTGPTERHERDGGDDFNETWRGMQQTFETGRDAGYRWALADVVAFVRILAGRPWRPSLTKLADAIERGEAKGASGE